MTDKLPAITEENEKLTSELSQLYLEFLDLFTRHKEMVENESVILASLYLGKLGHLQLELLEKQTEASRLKMKMNLIQAAINRDEKPDLKAIEHILNQRLQKYYEQIEAQSAELDQARNVLTHLISPEETAKLRETFRVLCKRLHPDLNPNQTEVEKDLFIKVKAAYDLQRLSDLQQILLYLDDSTIEKLELVSGNEKKERIENLKASILDLTDKIEKLKLSFPFNVAELVYNEVQISLQQEELRNQIKIVEEECAKYTNILTLMTDE